VQRRCHVTGLSRTRCGSRSRAVASARDALAARNRTRSCAGAAGARRRCPIASSRCGVISASCVGCRARYALVYQRVAAIVGPAFQAEISEVRAATPPDLRALAQLAHKNPETVMLHFVQPAGRRADDQRAQADTGGRNRPAGFVANGPGRRATIRLSSRTFFESPNERRTRTTDSISAASADV
jgi:hypothetical protein